MSMYDVKQDSFSGEDKELAETAYWIMNQVWNYIGYDVLELLGRSASRAEMLEMVLDADRMMTCARSDDKEKQLKACQYVIWMEHHNNKLWKKFLREKFPFKRYG